MTKAKTIHPRVHEFQDRLAGVRDFCNRCGFDPGNARLSMTGEQAVAAINWFDVEFRPALAAHEDVRSKHSEETWHNMALFSKMSKDLPEWLAYKKTHRELMTVWKCRSRKHFINKPKSPRANDVDGAVAATIIEEDANA